MHRLELPHHCQASQLQGVVFVGLAFRVLPPPSFFVGATDECFDLVFLAQVADPTAGPTGFHDHQVDLVVGQHGGQVASVRRDRLKPILMCLGVEKAAHRVELAEVDSTSCWRFDRRHDFLGLPK